MEYKPRMISMYYNGAVIEIEYEFLGTDHYFFGGGGG